MQFRKCSIAGIAYGGPADGSAESGAGGENPNATENVNFQDPRLLENLQSGHPTAEVVREFLTLLAVCHTVIPELDDDGSIKPIL